MYFLHYPIPHSDPSSGSSSHTWDQSMNARTVHGWPAKRKANKMCPFSVEEKYADSNWKSLGGWNQKRPKIRYLHPLLPPPGLNSSLAMHVVVHFQILITTLNDHSFIPRILLVVLGLACEHDNIVTFSSQDLISSCRRIDLEKC